MKRKLQAQLLKYKDSGISYSSTVAGSTLCLQPSASLRCCRKRLGWLSCRSLFAEDDTLVCKCPCLPNSQIAKNLDEGRHTVNNDDVLPFLKHGVISVIRPVQLSLQPSASLPMHKWARSSEYPICLWWRLLVLFTGASSSQNHMQLVQVVQAHKSV